MGSPLKFATIETGLGWVGVALSGEGLRAVNLPLPTREAATRAIVELGAGEPATEAELGDIPAAVQGLASGTRAANSVRLDWTGISDFRRTVLEECARIPRGETRTYAWLAEQVGRPRAARAVGRVMATNPWPLFVPCHRVLGSDGSLHGYGGGLPMKEALLRAEGAPHL
jgi:methylated-DNA-[protein]-cysteine S-methyltransferase